jgi:DNA-binding XRE family transcriptional regulator
MPSHLASHSGQNLENPNPVFNQTYSLNLLIPKQIFNEGYPVKPETFGEKFRKARMDAGLQIKELAALVGVIDDTVINWEKRGMRPHRRCIRNKLKYFMENLKNE